MCLVISWTVAYQTPCLWDSPGENTGVGCHFLLQRTFPTQGPNPGLTVFQADSLPSEPPGKPIPHFGGDQLRIKAHQRLINTRGSQEFQQKGHSVQSLSHVHCDPMDCSHRLFCLWDFPGQNPGVGCHFLLQRTFPTPGSNLCPLLLLHCRQTLYRLSYKGSPNKYTNLGLIIKIFPPYNYWQIIMITDIIIILRQNGRSKRKLT